jgi:pantoate--beta-alanine ligase
MQVIRSSKEMQQFALKKRAEGKSIGFVPTMGFLHEGHAGLMKEAKKTTEVNIVSVFVNPTQFGPNEDFETYPRDFNHDLALIESEGMDVLFYPEVSEIYSEKDLIELHVSQRTDVLCGTSRPGHFDGVVTVLTKLFHLTQPTVAYFGMKDAQQVAVVEGLIHTFHFPIEVKRVPIIREQDGLAKSSRNVRLTEAERNDAPVIYETLVWGRKRLESGEVSVDVAENEIKQRLTEKLKLGKIDYVQILSYPELSSLQEPIGELILAVAVFYQNVRLIDNIILEVKKGH